MASFAFDEPIELLMPPSDENLLALTHAGGLLRCDSGFSRRVAAHRGPVHDVAFSPSGNWAASAGDDKQIQLIDWIRGSIVRTIPCGDEIVRCLVVTPDGKPHLRRHRARRRHLGCDHRPASGPSAGRRADGILAAQRRRKPPRRGGFASALHGWDLRALQPMDISAEAGTGTKLVGFLGGDGLFVADSKETTAHVQHVLGQTAVRASSAGVSAIAQVPDSDEVVVANGTAEVGSGRYSAAANRNSRSSKGR